ncbi:SRPBCC family protein [Pseudonocardia sp. WMMC193]|uniref:SRPBCC family protein n=1 Tax=Pseudonocardia sp. WMMC193 TaxID=2911965 RepID=UPI001F429B45|nr:SRPBCC family protein [Pseudonocardia sp. WMMC193]MCF7550712.1 SRPBCC family protein [Pseudonocardia sp. WMMC193]
MQIEAAAERSFAVPASRLWPLVSSVRGYLDTIPEVVAYECDSAGRVAAFDARLAVGPVTWKLAGSAAVDEISTGETVSVSLTVPKLVLGYAGGVSVHDVGEGSCRVEYRGTITCEHKMIGKLHFLLRQILDDHVARFLDGVVGEAERTFQAEQALLRRGNPSQRRG